MIFDAKSRIPAKYYNLATWNFRQQRALFRLELLTQLPWRGKGLMTHPQFRCPGKGIPPMKCSKDGIETLNHPILGRRPDSDVIGIPEFLRGNIQRILEFQDLLFLLETHSKNYMKHLLFERNHSTIAKSWNCLFSKPVSTHQVLTTAPRTFFQSILIELGSSAQRW